MFNSVEFDGVKGIEIEAFKTSQMVWIKVKIGLILDS